MIHNITEVSLVSIACLCLSSAGFRFLGPSLVLGIPSLCFCVLVSRTLLLSPRIHQILTSFYGETPYLIHQRNLIPQKHGKCSIRYRLLFLGTKRYGFLKEFRNRLSTGNRLISWGLNVPSSCLLCYAHAESVEHLFFTCCWCVHYASNHHSASSLPSND